MSSEAYAAITRALDELDLAKDEVSHAQNRLADELRDGLAAAPFLIPVLYWEHEIKATVLSTAAGCSLNDLKRLRGCDDVEAECPCGDLFVARCRSHAEREVARKGELSCLACNPRGGYNWPERLPGRRDLDRVAALRSMTYENYLRTPEWAETRDKALDRAHHSCQVCSSKYGLQVHHNTYDRFGSEQPRDLLVLCRDDHKLFHAHGRLKR